QRPVRVDAGSDAGRDPLGREPGPGPDHGGGADRDPDGEQAPPMTFDLNLTVSDLLLVLPEVWVTLWICVVLCVDFLRPRMSQRTIAGLSVAGLGVALVFLLGCYAEGPSGALLTAI